MTGPGGCRTGAAEYLVDVRGLLAEFGGERSNRLTVGQHAGA